MEYRILARVVIAKVKSVGYTLERTLEALPIYQSDDSDRRQVQSSNCLVGVKSALEALRGQGISTGLRDWEFIQRQSLDYVDKKAAWGGVECGLGGRARF